jgi:hypothetical protein
MSITNAAASGVTVAAPNGLRNNDAVGVIIDRLTFTSPVNNSQVTGRNCLHVSLRYKGLPLTNGWVPVGAFCPVVNERLDTKVNAVTLSKPLYLGPNEWIDVSVTNPLGVGIAATTGFVVNAQGHFADPPREKWLPYFSHFMGAARDGSSNAVFAEASTPQDLGNPFPDRPLIIERLIGRVALATAAAGPYTLFSPNAGWLPFNLRISDDQSRWWIQTPAPIHIAMNSLTRAWRLNYALPPSSFLRVEVEGTATWTSNANVPQFGIPIVGMVGYRRIG